eukprot:537295_1
MEHIRHKQMSSPLRRDHMLSLILYTGGYCNYDLCSSQRNGDYIKWKWFDFCLYQAIEKLSIRESGSFSVYSGLNHVKMDQKQLKRGWFSTYVSTSWKKEVSQTFMSGTGMMIQIDKSFKDSLVQSCCDVSWISKFQDECEILFSRHIITLNYYDGFKCSVLNESNGIQTVLLSEKK